MTDIRNFCLIAHIDHGKSTLADRLLEMTGALDKQRNQQAQVLDTMELEQERGITIKLQPVRLWWKGVQLNLIDTPGHVDFCYEVSRSLAACEGAILVVDATQGVQAQTLANIYLGLEQNLTIVPVLNKIDLPAADIDTRKEEIANILGIDATTILPISAKTGAGIEDLLDKIIETVPPPSDNLVFHSDPAVFTNKDETRALVFDSTFDSYRGVVCGVRVFAGELRAGDRVHLLRSGQKLEITEVGYWQFDFCPTDLLQVGEVGYVVTGSKDISGVRVGETIFGSRNTAKDPLPLPGYKTIQPMVYAGIFPLSGDDFPELQRALGKLALNDAALCYEMERSGALGHGFRVGALGLLHMDIVRERLDREFMVPVIITTPSVCYRVTLTTKEEIDITNPSQLPENNHYTSISEPWVRLNIFCPVKIIGGLIKSVTERGGHHLNSVYLSADRVELHMEMPLAAMITDFYDEVKSLSAGYASMNYELIGLRVGDLVRLDFLIAGEKVEALSQIVRRSEAMRMGRLWCQKLKQLIPRAQFAIAIQAAIGAKVLVRENISPTRKNVTAKLYGGDVTRKRKLLEKQKKGKKRLKQFGKVSIPTEAFLSVLRK